MSSNDALLLRFTSYTLNVCHCFFRQMFNRLLPADVSLLPAHVTIKTCMLKQKTCQHCGHNVHTCCDVSAPSGVNLFLPAMAVCGASGHAAGRSAKNRLQASRVLQEPFSVLAESVEVSCVWRLPYALRRRQQQSHVTISPTLVLQCKQSLACGAVGRVLHGTKTDFDIRMVLHS